MWMRAGGNPTRVEGLLDEVHERAGTADVELGIVRQVGEVTDGLGLHQSPVDVEMV